MGRGILFHGEDEIEDWTLGRIEHGREPFAEPTRAGEQINDRYGTHSLEKSITSVAPVAPQLDDRSPLT